MNKKRFRKLIGCVLILTLMFPYAALADTQGNSPELEVLSAQANAGQSAAVDIVIHRPQGLKTFEFSLHYDSSALALSDADVVKGADVQSWLFEYKIDSANGIVKIAAVRMDGFESNDQAAVARLNFTAAGSAGVKPFSITGLKGFLDVTTAADMASRAGAFTILGGPQPTPTPSPQPTSSPAPSPRPSGEPGSPDDGGSGLTVHASVDRNEIKDMTIEIDKDVVTIKVDAPQSSGSIQISLDKNSVNQIVDDEQSIVVQSPLGAIALDAATIARLAGSDIVIEIEQGALAEGRPSRTVKVLADGREVSRFAGKATVSVPYVPEAAEVADSIVVYRTVGNERVIVPQSRAINGEVVFLAQGSSTFVVGYNEKTFADTSGHWSNANIGFAAAREIFLGVSEDAFAPEASMTRGMLVTVLGRMIGIDGSVGESGFTDVKAEAYYAPYVAFADQHGIVSGNGNGQFSPDREVTREEMAKIIVGFMQYAQIQASAPSVHAAFEDEAAISDWASAAIRQLQEAGILNGKSGNMFDPQGYVKRAEAAKVLRLLLEAYVI